MHRALIVCNGEPPPLELFQRLWKQAHLKVCADGGVRFVMEQGLMPDLVIGDFDSIPPECLRRLPLEKLLQVEEQQTNDTDKALRYCLQHRLKEVHVLGASGGRTDHFLANLEILYKYSAHIAITLWTAGERIQVIEKQWHDLLTPGTQLSLVPLFGPAHGITTSGLAYPLQEATLQVGVEPCGLSNEVTSTSVSIRIAQGKLLLIIQRSDGS